MKKAIIILTIITVILIGLVAYLGREYIEILDTLNIMAQEKSDILDKQIDLKYELELTEYQYSYDFNNLLQSNKECKVWQNLNETMKQINK